MSVLVLLAAAPVLALLILAYDWLRERWAQLQAGREDSTGLKSVEDPSARQLP
jgi:hypothetical protein